MKKICRPRPHERNLNLEPGPQITGRGKQALQVAEQSTSKSSRLCR